MDGAGSEERGLYSILTYARFLELVEVALFIKYIFFQLSYARVSGQTLKFMNQLK